MCQTNKYEALFPADLLQPLPIPIATGADISLDFVTGLPKSHGIDCVLVAIDRLTKYAHFLTLRHPCTEKISGKIIRQVVKLHGVPSTIVSDRNPIFISNFRQEIFRLMCTSLVLSLFS